MHENGTKRKQTPIILIGTEEEPRIYLGTEANFTDIDKKNIEENTKARHTHNNKEILDGITQENIKNWNDKYTKEEIKTELINPLKEQINGLSEDVEELKENSGSGGNSVDTYTKQEIDDKLKSKQDNLTIDNVVGSNSKNSSNPVSGKAVYPLWEDTETLKGEYDGLSNIVKGANNARSFETYKALIDRYDSLDSPHIVNDITTAAEYYTPTGSSMYIKTLNVPDLWVMKRLCDEENVVFPFTPYCENIYSQIGITDLDTEEEKEEKINNYIVDQLNQYGEFSIKWLTFAQLETQKVDLTNIPTKVEVNTLIQQGIIDSWEVEV